MKKHRKEFEFPANPEYFNCEDANEEVSIADYEDVMCGFTGNEEDKEVTSHIAHINMNNYLYLEDELGYSDEEYELWEQGLYG